MALSRFCYDPLSTEDKEWICKNKKSVDVGLREVAKRIFKIKIAAGVDDLNPLPNGISRCLHCIQLHVSVRIVRVNERGKVGHSRRQLF